MKQAEEKAADIAIRLAGPDDAEVVWQIIEPVIRSGDTYALPSDMTADDAIGYWFAPGHQVFLASDAGETVGTYFLCANNLGGGDHVANAGYITAASARGRGIAKAMCLRSIQQARSAGFLAMQFNFVVATNIGAVRLWQSLGFDIVGRLPEAFRHPGEGMVDALIMYRRL
jgi:GNAT superfamily N-acetyltransferase